MKLLTLSDVCSDIVDCEHKTAPIDAAGMYFAVGTPAMRGNFIDHAAARRINRDTYDQWTRRLAPLPGDVLFAREAPVGPVVQIPWANNVAPGQRTVLLRADPQQLVDRFLYYWLINPLQQSVIQSFAAGSTVPHLNVADVRTLPIQLPSIDIQKAIAEVLGALDDKIAANSKLAQIADELVRSWYMRLCSGNEHWTVLGAIAENVRETVAPEEVTGHYVGLEHVPRRRMWLDTSGSVSDVTSAKSRFNTGDVLFGKLRPYFHKVVATPWAGVASTDILVIRAKDEELRGLVLAAASSDEAVAIANASSEGTRMPRAKWPDLANLEVPAPDCLSLDLSGHIYSLSASVHAHFEENRILAQTRDALLPQLMSGKLRVKDAEAIVSEAT